MLLTFLPQLRAVICRRALDIISNESWFEDYAVRKQDFLSTEEKRSKVVGLISDDDIL
jgi:hypothetical protein